MSFVDSASWSSRHKLHTPLIDVRCQKHPSPSRNTSREIAEIAQERYPAVNRLIDSLQCLRRELALRIFDTRNAHVGNAVRGRLGLKEEDSSPGRPW